MDKQSGGRKSGGRPDSSRPGHPALRGVDSRRPGRFMLQEASRRGAEINSARTDATLGEVAAERESKRWRTWLPVPVATMICLAVHWFAPKTEPPAETRSYF